jgi:hypothetical protein
LPQEANVTIDEYIDEDYCFIVSWISDVEEFRNESLLGSRYYYLPDGYIVDKYTNSIIGTVKDLDIQLTLGVSINFPTEKIFYPLKLTSVYGSETIPIFIQVIDYVTPSKYPDVSQDGFMRTNYYVDDSYSVPINLTTFFAEQLVHSAGNNIQNLRYTEIEIHSKAKYLTEDLWIENSAPAGVSALDFIASNGWLVLLLIFISISCFSSLLAGIIVFYKQKPSFYKFALLGLSNFASLIGFFAATFALKIDQKFVKIPLEKKTIEKKKTSSLSPITWIGIAIAIVLLVLAPILLNPYYSVGILLLFMLLFGPVIGIIAMFVYGARKDKQKTVFTVLFSIFFMVFLFLVQIILQVVL